MNLVLEIGNTTVKLARFEGNQLLSVLRTDDERVAWDELGKYQFEKAILAGSGNLNTALWMQIQSDVKNIFHPEMCNSIFIRYERPVSLGQDRIINAYYASILFPNRNNLVIDAGTCLTYTFINANHELIGGSISPGLKMKTYSLHQYTDKLPLVDYATVSQSVSFIGHNTEKSILSGVIQGSIYEIESRIEHYQSNYTDLNIIMTGGDALFLQNKIKYKIFADSDFTLKGLNQILNTI